MYRANQPEYVIHILVVAPQEYVNTNSTRRYRIAYSVRGWGTPFTLAFTAEMNTGGFLTSSLSPPEDGRISLPQVNRSTGHTHTHTHRQRTTPPTPTHAHDKSNNLNPQTNTSHKHLTTLEGGATTCVPPPTRCLG